MGKRKPNKKCYIHASGPSEGRQREQSMDCVFQLELRTGLKKLLRKKLQEEAEILSKRHTSGIGTGRWEDMMWHWPRPLWLTHRNWQEANVQLRHGLLGGLCLNTELIAWKEEVPSSGSLWEQPRGFISWRRCDHASLCFLLSTWVCTWPRAVCTFRCVFCTQQAQHCCVARCCLWNNIISWLMRYRWGQSLMG